MTARSQMVVAVTGAASGIGAAAARRFAADGAHVLVADLQVEAGTRIADEIGSEFARCDVSHEADVAALVDGAVARFGRLDCIVNNAGLIGATGSILDIEASAWSRTIAVLLDGVFYGMKHAARVMKPRGSGVILSTTSIAGLVPLGPHAYSAAKHGVVGLTKSVASELAPYGIRVNAVAPGTVPTYLTGQFHGGGDAVRKLGAERNPLGVAVETDEIAAAFAYLASPAARSITGQVLAVDAGLGTCIAPRGYYERDAAFVPAEGQA